MRPAGRVESRRGPASNDDDVPPPPPIIPYGGFSRYGWKLAFRAGPSASALGEACSRHTLAHMQFATVLRASATLAVIPLCVGLASGSCCAMRGLYALYPRGPRSGPGYAVPAINRFSPVRPLATQNDFAAVRLIRPAFARAGAPRRSARGSGLTLAIPSWHVVARRQLFLSLATIKTIVSVPASGFPLPPPEGGNIWLILALGTSFLLLGTLLSLVARGLLLLCDPTGGSMSTEPSETFTSRLHKSVILLAAGYDYGSYWTLLPVGLSPTGMQRASLRQLRSCTHRKRTADKRRRRRRCRLLWWRRGADVTRRSAPSLPEHAAIGNGGIRPARAQTLVEERVVLKSTLGRRKPQVRPEPSVARWLCGPGTARRLDHPRSDAREVREDVGATLQEAPQERLSDGVRPSIGTSLPQGGQERKTIQDAFQESNKDPGGVLSPGSRTPVEGDRAPARGHSSAAPG